MRWLPSGVPLRYCSALRMMGSSRMTVGLNQPLHFRAADAFVGRSAELSPLASVFGEEGPLVGRIHGVGGICAPRRRQPAVPAWSSARDRAGLF